MKIHTKGVEMNELKTLEELAKFGFRVLITQDSIELHTEFGMEWYKDGGTIEERLFQAKLYLDHLSGMSFLQ